MESATANNVTTIKFSPMEFDLVRLTFFKRNTQEFLLIKEVLSFVRSYVQSVEIIQVTGEKNIDFKFFLPFNNKHREIYRLCLEVSKWHQYGNYSLGLYFEDKTSYHFLNLIKTDPARWDEENGYLRHTFSKQIKLAKLHKFLSVVRHTINTINR